MHAYREQLHTDLVQPINSTTILHTPLLHPNHIPPPQNKHNTKHTYMHTHAHTHTHTQTHMHTHTHTQTHTHTHTHTHIPQLGQVIFISLQQLVLAGDAFLQHLDPVGDELARSLSLGHQHLTLISWHVSHGSQTLHFLQLQGTGNGSQQCEEL